MSAISNIYDAVVARVVAVFPSHTRLSNPYAIEQNPEGFLRQGYGIAIGPCTNTNRNLCHKVSILRDIIITITRQYAAVETDIATKVTAEKLLLEDQIDLISDFMNNTTLSADGGIVSFTNDGGIEQVFPGGRDNFIALKLTFTVEHFEDIT